MMKIIAEVGCNHQNMKEAFQFIEKSKELGLFATKFQVYHASQIQDHPQKEFLFSIMLGYEECKELFEYGQDIGQEVFFTPMFENAVDWLEEIGVHYYKIRYADRYNNKLLEAVVNTNKLGFISQNLEDLKIHGTRFYDSLNLFPLYCVPKYPAKFNDYKMICLGMSDHTGKTELLKICDKIGTQFHEIHCKLDNTKPLEDIWSVSFSELEGVLK